MKKSKLIDLFEALEPNEYRFFFDFVCSPYYNKDTNIIALAEYLIKVARKGFPDTSLAVEKVWMAVFPSLPLDEKKLSYLNSGLLHLGESFLAQRAIEADGEVIRLYQLEACLNRGLDKSWRSILRKVEVQLARRSKQTLQRLHQWFRFQNLQQKAYTRLGDRKPPPYLQPTVDALDSYYFARKLQLNCEMLNYQRLANATYIFRFADEGDRRLIGQLPNSELAQLHAKAYELLQTENREDLFVAFIDQLSSTKALLARSAFTYLYVQGINYCVRQIRSGYRAFIPMLQECYREGLRNGYLLENGSLSPGTYKNILKLGLGLGEIDWVNEVVEKYTKLLMPGTQSDAYHFNRAEIAYYQKEYPAALSFLQQTEFNDVHYAIGAKSMLCKIYYETEETEALLALLFSFNLYLLRNRLIGQSTKEAYRNFIRFTKQLERAKHKEAFGKLKHKVIDCKALSDRNWLMKQIEKKYGEG